MDVELREYFENLNIKIDELKLSIIDSRREFNERLNSLGDRFDEKLVNLEIRFDAKLESLDNRIDAKLKTLEDRFDAKLETLENRLDEKLQGLEARFDAKLNEKTEEFKRYVGILSEEFQSKITLVIEGQEIIHREMNEFKQQNGREHEELYAMIKLTYSDHESRLKRLEFMNNIPFN